MGSGKDHIGCAVAARERAPERCCRGKGGSDAWDDLKWNSGFTKRSYLFGGTAEDERIAAL
jgi:hypothetical protein